MCTNVGFPAARYIAYHSNSAVLYKYGPNVSETSNMSPKASSCAASWYILYSSHLQCVNTYQPPPIQTPPVNTRYVTHIYFFIYFRALTT